MVKHHTLIWIQLNDLNENFDEFKRFEFLRDILFNFFIYVLNLTNLSSMKDKTSSLLSSLLEFSLDDFILLVVFFGQIAAKS